MTQGSLGINLAVGLLKAVEGVKLSEFFTLESCYLSVKTQLIVLAPRTYGHASSSRTRFSGQLFINERTERREDLALESSDSIDH